MPFQFIVEFDGLMGMYYHQDKSFSILLPDARYPAISKRFPNKRFFPHIATIEFNANDVVNLDYEYEVDPLTSGRSSGVFVLDGDDFELKDADGNIIAGEVTLDDTFSLFNVDLKKIYAPNNFPLARKFLADPLDPGLISRFCFRKGVVTGRDYVGTFKFTKEDGSTLEQPINNITTITIETESPKVQLSSKSSYANLVFDLSRKDGNGAPIPVKIMLKNAPPDYINLKNITSVEDFDFELIYLLGAPPANFSYLLPRFGYTSIANIPGQDPIVLTCTGYGSACSKAFLKD